MASESVATAHKVVSEMLGKYPEDIIASLKSSADALSWVETLLRVAAAQERQGPHSDAARMVKAAQYIAMDFGNLIDCERESMRDSLTLFSLPGARA